MSDEGLLKLWVIKKAPSRDAYGRSERADLEGQVRERWIRGSFSGGTLTVVGGREASDGERRRAVEIVGDKKSPLTRR